MKKEEFKEKYKVASTLLTPLFKDEVKKSNEKLGRKEKLVVCMEEMAELSQAISKFYRNNGDELNLIEEIGDVLICIESLKQFFNITDSKINKAINVKIDRGIS